MGFVTALGFAIFIKRNHGCKMHIEILEVCLHQETKELDQIRIWIRLECKKKQDGDEMVATLVSCGTVEGYCKDLYLS